MALLVAGGITAAVIAVAGGYSFYRLMRGEQRSPVQEVDAKRPLEDDSGIETKESIKHDDEVSATSTVNDTSQSEDKSEPGHEKSQAESESTPSTDTLHKKQMPPVVAPKPQTSKHGSTTTKAVPPVSPKPLATQQHRKPMTPISPNAIPVLPVAFGVRGNLKRTGIEGKPIYQATENQPETGIIGGEEVPVTFEEVCT